jgi:hypothetical protein
MFWPKLINKIGSSPAVVVVSSVSDTESGESGGGSGALPASGAHPVKADFIVKALITISKATTYDAEGAKELVKNPS